jgi:hypothetical protein
MTNDFTTFTSASKIGRDRPNAIAPTTSGAEALALAGIDWTVRQTPLSDLLDVPGADEVFHSQRSDNNGIVGTNGTKYNVIQNTVLAELCDAVRQVRPDARYVAGGEKNGGKTTFLMLELEDALDLGGGDKVYRNLLAYKGHNGGAVKFLPTPFRPWCMNQWGRMMRSSGDKLVAIPHTASHEERTRLAIKLVQDSVQVFDEWDRALRELTTTPVRAGDHFKVIAGERPEDGRALTEWENRVDRLWAEYSQDFNSQLIGTAAGVLMAAQGVDEHGSKVNFGQRDAARIGRVIAGNYPLANAALASLGVA